MAEKEGMIEPFAPSQVRHANNRPLISYGVSSYGYDVRCAEEFKIFTNLNSTMVDPKNFDTRSFVSHIGDTCIIPPNSFVLSRTVEHFRIPRDILVICLGKSTYARCGIVVNVTPLEPEWEGHVTLEFSNTTSLPAKIYSNEGVAQMVFLQADEVCELSYKDRAGKYQGQPALFRLRPKTDVGRAFRRLAKRDSAGLSGRSQRIFTYIQHGHLIIAAHWLGENSESAKLFEVVIQLGAVLAVCWEYRRRL